MPKTIREEKEALRKAALAKTRSLSKAYMESSDRIILEKVLALPAFRDAKVIFTYVSMTGEPDTHELIERALKDGKKVAVPRCRKNGVMDLKIITDLSDLSEEGAFGIQEPPGDAEDAEPGEVDLAVVPCVMAGKDGQRLGHGGGYYDRFLEVFRGISVILCYSELTGEIPREEHDLAADLVITEANHAV